MDEIRSFVITPFSGYFEKRGHIDFCGKVAKILSLFQK
jgi:hypothetical protein